jgi:FtsZ-binding cell division protein ZapB
MNWITGRPDKGDSTEDGLRAEISALKERCAELIRTNRKLREEIETLKKRASSVQEAAQKDWWKGRPAAETTTPALVEKHGVLWQPSADGRIEPICYCPKCRLVMTPLPSGYPTEIMCTRCRFKAPFRPEQLPELVRTIAAEMG